MIPNPRFIVFYDGKKESEEKFEYWLSELYTSIDEAVIHTIEYCIYNNILREFLIRNKVEVIEMSILECNYEEELKKIGDDRYEDGFHDGLE